MKSSPCNQIQRPIKLDNRILLRQSCLIHESLLHDSLQWGTPPSEAASLEWCGDACRRVSLTAGFCPTVVTVLQPGLRIQVSWLAGKTMREEDGNTRLLMVIFHD